LFLLEGIPAVLIGFVVLWVLPNGPEQVRWLSDREKGWIRARLKEEASVVGGGQTHRLRDIFSSGRIWLLCLIYFLLNVGAYGFEMWAPTIVKEFSGLNDFAVGLINAVPYVTAGVVMLLVGRHSDRTGERRGHVAASAICAAIGFVLAAYFKNPVLAMGSLAIAFAGLKSTLGPFWAMTTAFLTGTAAAGGIALINSVGNLGGYFGPRLVGLLKSETGNNFGALLLLAGALLGMGLFALLVPVKKSAEATTNKINR
jgi:nitrate/nitrite transporter NarK